MRLDDGYAVDVPYVCTFRHACTPINLAFSALAGGFKATAPANFTYLDLGCGNGYQICALAALYPKGAFYGADFMAEHVEHGHAFAAAAKLPNVTFVETAFRDLLERIDTLPKMDFVCLHGVYTWVSAENRALIGQILQKIMKPGGLIYIAYNAMPGCAGASALQTLMMERARVTTGSSAVMAAEGLAQARKLANAGASFFAKHPSALERAITVESRGPNYMAHEFIGSEWVALPFGTVARAMADLGLDYVGQTDFRFSVADLELSPGLEAEIEAASDPIWRETLVDYALSTQFRTDVYIYKGERLNDAARDAALRATPVTLLLESGLFPAQITRDWGVSDEAAEQLLAVADSARVVTLGELYKAVADELPWPRFLTVMRHSLLISRFALARPDEVDAAPGRRFNAHVMAERPFGARYPHACCPAIGTALELPHRLLLVTEAWEAGAQTSQEMIDSSMARLAARGQTLHGASDTAQTRAQLAEFADNFEGETAKVMRNTGLVHRQI
jgi:Predicted methyltransferase regulatory domain/Methyltransferase domain